MSFLLGSEYCIQSLSNDVRDVQGCIKDIIHKIGRISSISWKFPDKFACDLNIDDHLLTYKYDLNDIEHNQISHIILLELIIDRICLLLQLHCESIEKLINKKLENSNTKVPSKNTKIFSPCLGLISKKHWNKLCQLTIYMENLHKEIVHLKKINKEQQTEMENLKVSENNYQSKEENGSNKDNISKQASDWLKTLENDTRNQSINKKLISVAAISKDVTFKSSQTVDTAFKPCESCHISQTCLRESSSLIMKILKDESLPSFMTKLQDEIMTIDWLSDKKLLQIKDSFSKDLDKICKHFRLVKQKEMKTNENLSDSQNKCATLTEILENLKSNLSEMNAKFAKEKENYESKINDYDNQIKHFQEQIAKTNEDLIEKSNQFKEEKSDLIEKMEGMKSTIKQFDEVKKAIFDFDVDVNDPLKALGLIKDKLVQQNDSIISLSNKLQNQMSINDNLSASEILVKEKEDKVVKRLQNLTEQKHKLEEKIDVLQEQLQSNQESLRILESQKTVMTMKLSDQQTLIEKMANANKEFNSRIQELEEQVKSMESTVVDVTKEKKLLLHYPDLNGTLDKFDSGSIDLDIQNQITANATRIKLLSEQNSDLANALKKLSEKPVCNAVQLPKSNSGLESEGSRSPNDVVIQNPMHIETYRPGSKSSYVSAMKRTPQKNKPPSRPRSRDKVPLENSLIQWSVSNNKINNINQLHACELCGRQYPQKLDLEVHKEYCTSRRRRLDQK